MKTYNYFVFAFTFACLLFSSCSKESSGNLETDVKVDNLTYINESLSTYSDIRSRIQTSLRKEKITLDNFTESEFLISKFGSKEFLNAIKETYLSSIKKLELLTEAEKFDYLVSQRIFTNNASNYIQNYLSGIYKILPLNDRMILLDYMNKALDKQNLQNSLNEVEINSVLSFANSYNYRLLRVFDSFTPNLNKDCEDRFIEQGCESAAQVITKLVGNELEEKLKELCEKYGGVFTNEVCGLAGLPNENCEACLAEILKIQGELLEELLVIITEFCCHLLEDHCHPEDDPCCEVVCAFGYECENGVCVIDEDHCRWIGCDDNYYCWMPSGNCIEPILDSPCNPPCAPFQICTPEGECLP